VDKLSLVAEFLYGEILRPERSSDRFLIDKLMNSWLLLLMTISPRLELTILRTLCQLTTIHPIQSSNVINLPRLFLRLIRSTGIPIINQLLLSLSLSAPPALPRLFPGLSKTRLLLVVVEDKYLVILFTFLGVPLTAPFSPGTSGNRLRYQDWPQPVPFPGISAPCRPPLVRPR
jgi:hypothetical protein